MINFFGRGLAAFFVLLMALFMPTNAARGQVALKPLGTTPPPMRTANRPAPIVRLLSVSTCKGYRLEGHTAGIGAVAFSPDNKILATGSADRTIRLWDVSTQKLLRTIKGIPGPVMCMTFTPNGKILAAGSDSYSLDAYNVQTGDAIAHIDVASAINNLVAPDNVHLVSAGDSGLYVWDIREEKRATVLSDQIGEFGTGIVLAKDRLSVFVCRTVSNKNDNTASTIHLENYDWKTARKISDVVAPSLQGVVMLASSPDNKIFGFMAHDIGWLGYDKPLSPAVLPQNYFHVGAILAPERVLVVMDLNQLGIWNPVRGEVLSYCFIPNDFHYDIAVSPDGHWAAVGGGRRLLSRNHTDDEDSATMLINLDELQLDAEKHSHDEAASSPEVAAAPRPRVEYDLVTGRPYTPDLKSLFDTLVHSGGQLKDADRNAFFHCPPPAADDLGDDYQPYYFWMYRTNMTQDTIISARLEQGRDSLINLRYPVKVKFYPDATILDKQGWAACMIPLKKGDLPPQASITVLFADSKWLAADVSMADAAAGEATVRFGDLPQEFTVAFGKEADDSNLLTIHTKGMLTIGHYYKLTADLNDGKKLTFLQDAPSGMKGPFQGQIHLPLPFSQIHSLHLEHMQTGSFQTTIRFK